MDMSKYKGMFIEEAREHLKMITGLLLNLEKEPNNQEDISTLFREYHSIKGMAASMAYNPIMEISHSMEDLLDNIRKKKIKVAKQILSLLFSGSDLLENMINVIDADEELDNQMGSELLKQIRKAEKDLKAASAEVSFANNHGIILDVDDIGNKENISLSVEEILDAEVIASEEDKAENFLDDDFDESSKSVQKVKKKKI